MPLIFLISLPGLSKVVSTVWDNIENGKHDIVEKAGDVEHVSPLSTGCVTLDQKFSLFTSWFLHPQSEDSNLLMHFRKV